MKLIDYESEPKGDMHEPLIKLESVDETPEAAPARVGHRRRSSESPKKDRADTQSHSFDQPSTSKSTGVRSERQSSKEGHRRGSTSSTSPQRRTDSDADAGTVPKRKTSTSPRAPLKKYKSIDSDEAIRSATHHPRLSQDSRRSSLGNELRRGSTSSTHRVHQINSQPVAPEKRHEAPQIPHIKRVSISATHL
ncbi:hypothetical protein OESDEN_17039 [Oesophagostomum dentatum]|uniref:Uncharacterized protein n=1 Tax=Oesophagostomum dentatum TaxID=61180 RepID=A0A0B1SEA8_OESDE|nr:hypothetical protein OESDEN_17039 [Oesophagostomum dentatum]